MYLTDGKVCFIKKLSRSVDNIVLVLVTAIKVFDEQLLQYFPAFKCEDRSFAGKGKHKHYHLHMEKERKGTTVHKAKIMEASWYYILSLKQYHV